MIDKTQNIFHVIFEDFGFVKYSLNKLHYIIGIKGIVFFSKACRGKYYGKTQSSKKKIMEFIDKKIRINI